MFVDDFVWLPDIVEKLEAKHHVTQDEAEEVLFNAPKYRFVESGHRLGEDVYSAGGQADSGRYLIVFFIHKTDKTALILTARDMDSGERNDMDENRESQESSISKGSTPEEISDFWDTHSLADHWDQTHEVEFEMRVQRRHRVGLDPEIYKQLEEEARTRGVTPETLVNQWISERLSTDQAA